MQGRTKDLVVLLGALPALALREQRLDHAAVLLLRIDPCYQLRVCISCGTGGCGTGGCTPCTASVAAVVPQCVDMTNAVQTMRDAHHDEVHWRTVRSTSSPTFMSLPA